jgi:hypothetical protein
MGEPETGTLRPCGHSHPHFRPSHPQLSLKRRLLRLAAVTAAEGGNSYVLLLGSSRPVGMREWR